MDTPSRAQVQPIGFSSQQANEIAAVAEMTVAPLRQSLENLTGRLDTIEDRLASLETLARGHDRSISAIWQNVPEGNMENNLESLRADIRAIQANTSEIAIGQMIKGLAITGTNEPITGAAIIANQGSASGRVEAGHTLANNGNERGAENILSHEGSNQPTEAPQQPYGQLEPSGKKKKKSRKISRKGNGADEASSGSESADSNSHSGSNSDSVTSESDSSASEGYTRDNRGGIFARKRRPAYKQLKELKPTNRDYKPLLSYRQYRLRNRSQRSRTGSSNRKVKEFLRHREIARKGERFEGRDGITILHFLEKVVEDVELVGLSEAQALLAIGHCLSGQARALFQSASGILPGGNGIASWAEAVQYLLQTYATDRAIEEAIRAMEALSQRADEDEKQFAARFTLAEQRCGNVHRWSDRKLLYIDSLHGSIKPLVARFNRNSRRATFHDVVEFAFEEGSAQRGKLANRQMRDILSPNARGLRPYNKPTVARREPSRAMLLEENAGLGSLLRSDSGSGSAEDEAYLVQSLGTSDLPSTSAETVDMTGLGATPEEPADHEPMLAINQPRVARVRPAGIPYADRRLYSSRPGWVERPMRTKPYGQTSQQGQQRAPGSTPEVCFRCYFPGHIAPDCRLDIGRFATLVVANYTNLPSHVQVPSASYWQAKNLLGLNSANSGLTTAFKAPEPSRAERHPQGLDERDGPEPPGEGPGLPQQPREASELASRRLPGSPAGNN